MRGLGSITCGPLAVGSPGLALQRPWDGGNLPGAAGGAG